MDPLEKENPDFSFRHIASAIVVIAFGWGSLWVGTEVGTIALANKSIVPEIQTASVLSPVETPDSFPEEKVHPSITIMIGGDVMFDRAVRRLGNQNGYDTLLSEVSPLFKSADLAIVNLEGPITSFPSKTLLPDGRTSKELVFTFATSTADTLSEAGVTAVSLANNHTDNFSQAGLEETKKWLDVAGVKWFGSPWNSDSTETVMEKNGLSVALVGYHEFSGGLDRTLAAIQRLSQAGHYVIVMPHWGDEYISSPSPKMRSLARNFVAAGADAVIGSHPHVVLDPSWIGDVPVFYSLGNLLFDQYFNAEVMRGNIVELNLVKNDSGVSLENVKVYETSMASKKGVTLNPEPVEFKTGN